MNDNFDRRFMQTQQDSLTEDTMKNVSGIACPRCKNFITIPISELTEMKEISCPYCGLKIVTSRRD